MLLQKVGSSSGSDLTPLADAPAEGDLSFPQLLQATFHMLQLLEKHRSVSCALCMLTVS